MVSRLVRIRDWNELGRLAGYKPAKLARMCGVSLRHLQRFFLSNFSQGPHEWLNRQRMLAAAALLLENRPLRLICAELGFKQLSHFCRMFKEQIGRTPDEFRRSSRCAVRQPLLPSIKPENLGPRGANRLKSRSDVAIR